MLNFKSPCVLVISPRQIFRGIEKLLGLRRCIGMRVAVIGRTVVLFPAVCGSVSYE